MSNAAPPPVSPQLDAAIKGTQAAMAQLIKRTPLTSKLLAKPPFRFLHDLITEAMRSSGFATGLYSDAELNSENVKEKDAKIAWLAKMADCIAFTLGEPVRLNPNKVVAGLDPEITNEFLQQLSRASQMDGTAAVKRVLGGERQRPSAKSSSPDKVLVDKDKAPPLPTPTPVAPPPTTATATTSSLRHKKDSEKDREKEKDKSSPLASKDGRGPKSSLKDSAKKTSASSNALTTSRSSNQALSPSGATKTVPAPQTSSSQSQRRSSKTPAQPAALPPPSPIPPPSAELPVPSPITLADERPTTPRAAQLEPEPRRTPVTDTRSADLDPPDQDTLEQTNPTVAAYLPIPSSALLPHQQPPPNDADAVPQVSPFTDVEPTAPTSGEQVSAQDDEPRVTGLVARRPIRPTTARAPPPRRNPVVDAGDACNSAPPPPVIVEDGPVSRPGDSGDADDDEEFVKVAGPGMVLAAGLQEGFGGPGGMTGAGWEEADATRWQDPSPSTGDHRTRLARLVDQVRTAAAAAGPLAALLELAGEDVDGMGGEEEQWRKEAGEWEARWRGEERETKAALEPVERQIREVEELIAAEHDRISSLKATVFQNETEIVRVAKSVIGGWK
ncbi:hypothetical protein M427DRAFT_54563 [Gonapodya prolifera JEL478]|uniref:TRAF3-interacting protein 1 n=1 Tax=Gonapodya prolifera (strain JEL478) TaxID=1344416 RepID=A0A139ALJ9_GONPJ|nr:hypothetical protein M427DRAFT_54563 [Gonapodya prolifera JEL478]|eukprot:KXS17640.1 hypothetical protein M427DRAFT_54563 [Gonapodya prolifera JEL478]